VTSRAERRARRRRRSRGLVVVTVFLLLVSGVLYGAFKLTAGQDRPKAAAGRPVTLTVLAGQDTREIATELERLGVVDSAARFRRVAADRGLDSALRPGSYSLTTGMPVDQVLDIMARGPGGIVLTIPEGLTQNQIVEKLVTVGRFKRAEVLAAMRDQKLISPYRPKGKPLEGLLYPQTYQINKDDTPATVVQAMLDQLQAVLANYDLSVRPGGVKLTPYQVLVVASLIEREAKLDADRPKVAAVIYNRLRRKMPLQIDATIQYAWRLRGKVKTKLSLEDLKIGSPYNTYKLAGLPPTPIASPGEASIQAALQPSEANWLYYVVVAADGRSAFTADYNQFVKLKQKAKADGVA